ncbi:MAG TPA: hypothetical protein ENI23_14035 [bacterium]|nr:hypothetical protein [bacterium]
MTKNKKEWAEILGGLFIFAILFGGVYWMYRETSKPSTVTTACGWETEENEDIYVCREYKRVNYTLEQ